MKKKIYIVDDLFAFRARSSKYPLQELLQSPCADSENILYYSNTKLGFFGMLKLALALQFIVTNGYFSVAFNTKVSVHATLK